MSSSNYILPLKAPNPLPASGVDIVTFKCWKNTLIAHIQQDSNHHHFMPGGKYSTWTAADLGTRIQDLDEDDEDKLVLDGKRDRSGEVVYNAEMTRLLNKRNAQLAKFITHVATLCHHTENDDITNHSTSLDWMFEYLKRHYGLETKGANFMNVSEHIFKKGTPYQTFYKQYRASFIDNLRKQGDVVCYKNNYTLLEDEKLTPTFENAIVLWALDKIDPRLPAKVKRNYGHQMTGNVTLRDVQPVIFEHIDSMLEELDQSQTSKLLASQSLADCVDLQAISTQNKNRGKFLNNRTGGKSNYRGRTTFKPSSSGKSFNKPTNKYCRICDLAGSDAKVFTSHEIGNCNRLSIRDFESIRNAMVLNGMVTLAEDEEESLEQSRHLQPGWDFEVAEDDSTDE